MNQQTPADKSAQAAPQSPPKTHNARPNHAPATKESQKTVRVDISLSGTPHSISCPSDKVSDLKKHTEALNTTLRQMRREIQGKNPTNEELLLLHCLELYDKMRILQMQLQDNRIEYERSVALIDKLLKNTQAVLTKA